MILMCFAPILFEALYWISASDRIVFSLFLSLASIYLLLKSFDEKSSAKEFIYYLLSIILNFICVGFYEQVVAINFLLFTTVLIILKKYKYLLIPITSSMWIGVYYIISIINGSMQTRGELANSSILARFGQVTYYIKARIIDAFYVMKESIKNIPINIFASFASILLAILIGYLICFLLKNKSENENNKFDLRKFILGIMIIVVSLLPFIVLANPYIAMRNLFIPFIGVAISFEVIFEWALNYIKNKNVAQNIKIIITSFLLIISVISNVNELGAYKRINELDNKIAKEVLSIVPEAEIDQGKTISINFNQDDMYKAKNTKANLTCAFEIDWSAMGKLQVVRNKVGCGQVYINSKQNEADYVIWLDERILK